MIGRLNIDLPDWNERTREAVENARQETRQGYAAMHTLGLWGAGMDNPRQRLYAGYQHIQTHPEDGAQWLLLAHTHAELGETDRALAILDELVRLGGFGLYEMLYQEDPRISRAHVLAAGGRFAEALEQINAEEDAHAGHPLYHYTRASLYHAAERFEEAIREYTRAHTELSEQRAEVEDAIDVDAALNVILAERIGAESGERFDGIRPLTLEGLVDMQISLQPDASDTEGNA